MGLAMVGLRRYINPGAADDDKPATILTRVLRRLSECGIDCDPQETQKFGEEMETITRRLAPDLPYKELTAVAEAALQAVDKYNRRIAEMVDRQRGDLKTIIRMLRDSIIKLAGENTDAVLPLSRIDEELEGADGFRDLQSLRMHLGVCLPNLRREIERAQEAAKALIERLQIEAENRTGPPEDRVPRSVDPAGLPGQEDCLAAIRDAIGRGTRHYAAVMVVNRVEPIAARFGKEAGDLMVARFREFAQRRFEATDRLFLWGPAAIVAIVERKQTFEQVRTALKRIFETPIGETIDINGRSVFVPISAALSVFMIPPTPETAEKQIQKFISAQGGRDFV